MMFLKGSNYIACVKVDGKILKDDAAGVVHLPFGSEFSILLKNLNSVRAQVKVSVDGTDATEGTWLIIPANGELELERYIRNGNFDRGNRFKFIERTGQIESNKGIGASDGLIRVEYKAEVVKKVVDETIVRKHYRDEYYLAPYPYPVYPLPWLRQPTITWGSQSQSVSSMSQGGQNVGANGSDLSGAVGGSNQQTVNTANMGVAYNSSTPSPTMGRPSGASSRTPLRAMCMTTSASSGRGRMQAQQVTRSAALNDVGITVPGSESSQKFVTGDWFKTEAISHVIVLQLRGMLAGKAVKTAVTVKSKAKCETCGTVNKSSIKFCGNCGTSLSLI